MVDQLSYFLFQPVLHDWCNKGIGMCINVLLVYLSLKWTLFVNCGFQELASTKKRLEEVEAARLANVPVDTAKEIKNLQKKIVIDYLFCFILFCFIFIYLIYLFNEFIYNIFIF